MTRSQKKQKPRKRGLASGIKKAGSGGVFATLQRVTRPPRGQSRQKIANDLVSKTARKLLRDSYKIFKTKGRGGWRAVAKRFGLKGPGQAMLMAQGERPICERMRAVVRMSGKRFFRGFIRKTVVPFLDKRQAKSELGVYGHNGKPIDMGRVSQRRAK